VIFDSFISIKKILFVMMQTLGKHHYQMAGKKKCGEAAVMRGLPWQVRLADGQRES
jgi:hypothetical protein